MRARAALVGVLFAFILLFFALAARPAHAQFFSPGKLARPHAALEGMKGCERCHDQNQHDTAGRCIACHVELAPGRAQGTGLHGRLPEATRDRCPRCHPDHRGLSFALIDWSGDKKAFDHARAGWPLAGAHARLGCASCHDARHVVAPEIVRMLRAQSARTTFLGLTKRCGACHFDEHRGQLGGAGDCQRCHDERSWRPAERFEHVKTDFPLRGKHGGLACTACHKALTDTAPAPALPLRHATTFLRFAPVEHATCASCHADPHEGRLGAGCAKCHTEDGWRVRGGATHAERSFHDRTAFPLEGAHAEVVCRACHGPFRGEPARFRGLAFRRCGDCHADAHAGQLAARPGAPAADCGACHSVTTFAPARFEAEQHAATSFPLDGSHRVVACRACHPLDGHLSEKVPAATRARLERQHRPLLVSAAVLRPHETLARCSSCHADPHAGQFTTAMAARDCAACHTTASFHAITFDHARDSTFSLAGAHARVACASCHTRAAGSNKAVEPVRYRPLDGSCGSCHRDPHAGQFTWQVARDDAAAPAKRRDDAKDCGACHAATTFAATTFRHDDGRATTFALEGRHAQLACGACHKPVRLADGATTVRYRPLPRTCSGCHVDFHKGDFKGFRP